MPLGVGLEVRGERRVEPAAEADVGRDVRALQVLHAEGQPHRVGLVLGDVDQEGVRVGERAEVLRAAEDDAVGALPGRRRPGDVVAVVHAGPAGELGVAGGGLLAVQALADEDGPASTPSSFEAVDEAFDGVGVGDDRVGEAGLLRRREVRLDRYRLGEGEAGALPEREDLAREGQGLAPDRLGVGLLGDLRPADEDGLRVRLDEGVQAQGARWCGRADARTQSSGAATVATPKPPSCLKKLRLPMSASRSCIPEPARGVNESNVRRVSPRARSVGPACEGSAVGVTRGTGSPATGPARGTGRRPDSRCGWPLPTQTTLLLNSTPREVSRRSFIPTSRWFPETRQAPCLLKVTMQVRSSKAGPFRRAPRTRIGTSTKTRALLRRGGPPIPFRPVISSTKAAIQSRSGSQRSTKRIPIPIHSCT